MKVSVKSNNRILTGNIAILVALFGLQIALWNEYTWYEAVAPFGTLVSFFALSIAFLAYVDIKEAVKDPAFWAITAASIVALVNLFIVRSGKGAFLTAFDVLMVLYLSDKILLSRKMLYICYGFVGFFFYYWTFDVKGYFKGYNTNYGGLVLITGFVFTMIGIECLRSYVMQKGYEKASKWMLLIYVWMFAWGYNIIAWYRARCALLGLIVFFVIVALPRKIWNNKWLYTLLTLSMTLGPIVFSWAYIKMSEISDVFTIRLFYKDAISGRNEVWIELWDAFGKKPFTGIGSSYEMNIDWLGGMFEVHSGMLDILFVHGIIVFAVVCVFLIRNLLRLRENAIAANEGKFVMAAAMAMLASSFLENYFIVPPFLIALLVLLCAGNNAELFTGNKDGSVYRQED